MCRCDFAGGGGCVLVPDGGCGGVVVPDGDRDGGLFLSVLMALLLVRW